MKTHRIKCLAVHFEQIAKKNKTAEIRLDDRGYRAGDFLILEELKPTTKTGREYHAMITHVLFSTDFQGLADGYCLLSFSGGRLYGPNTEVF